jgi:hypothetical protein
MVTTGFERMILTNQTTPLCGGVPDLGGAFGVLGKRGFGIVGSIGEAKVVIL